MYEHIRIRVSKHAHQQYCNRVEHIAYADLNEQCQRQLDNHQYGYNRRNYIHLDGVWWVYEMDCNTMNLITCYGRTNMHVPKALGWAARNRDRIDLTHLI
ncbi:hypothetical protein SD70_27265 [Gordoniibacillus kamchatkensis]|uniref:Uncharacterized protein n=1 Tax=Gordoniibacillus kamchatkensis TaxID=1590651 RepID=A0ABR5ABV7_9BACL|nr:hypothetical protein SD70_27265 [Paenibacillus sp. VKM B-2647]